MLIMHPYGLYHYLFILIEINKKIECFVKTMNCLLCDSEMENNTETNTTETNAGNPQITFWKVSYKHHTNFAMESIEQTFNGPADFGTTETIATAETTAAATATATAITETVTTMATTGTVTTGTTATTALEFQHTYRPIPQGFMGYGSSGAWDQCNFQ